MPETAIQPFTPDEYDARLSRTRAAMAAAEIEALIVTDPSNMAWLTGYDGWSFYVHQGCCSRLDGLPYWWGRTMDAKVPGDRVHGGRQISAIPTHYVQSRERHPMQHLVAQMQARGWAGPARGREGQLLFHGPAPRHAAARRCPRRGCSTPPASSTGSGRSRAGRDRLDPQSGADRRGDACADLRVIEPGLKKNELVAEI